jgi:hypothetical protein
MIVRISGATIFLLQGSENKAIVQYDHADRIQKVSVFSNDQVLLYQRP